MDPLPYNVTISAQSAAIVYNPSRDANATLEKGWNVTYTHGTSPTEFSWHTPQGVGDSYLRTAFNGAFMSLTWIGTAAYIYGNGTSSYSVQVDGTPIEPAPEGNLLARVTGLPYGSHTIILRYGDASGGDVLAIHYAVLTIGIGYEGSSFQVQNRSVPVILDGQPNNASFEFRKPGKWTPVSPDLQDILPDGSRQLVPRTISGLILSTDVPSLVFRITNSSAFFVRGFVGAVQGSKSATLTPGLNGEPFKISVFDDFSSILDFDQILYWESGLDRDQTYTVEIRASGSSGAGYMDIHTLDTIDGGPNPSVTSPPEKRSQLSTGSKSGITVGAVLAVILLASLALCWLRRHRSHQALSEASNITVFVGTKSEYPQRASPKHNRPVNASPSPFSGLGENLDPPHVPTSVTGRAFRHLHRLRQSFAPAVPVREIDAGPATLPPEYDHLWAVNAPAPVSRRPLPRPPGLAPPSTKVKSEQTADPRSSQKGWRGGVQRQ